MSAGDVPEHDLDVAAGPDPLARRAPRQGDRAAGGGNRARDRRGVDGTAPEQKQEQRAGADGEREQEIAGEADPDRQCQARAGAACTNVNGAESARGWAGVPELWALVPGIRA